MLEDPQKHPQNQEDRTQKEEAVGLDVRGCLNAFAISFNAPSGNTSELPMKQWNTELEQTSH